MICRVWLLPSIAKSHNNPKNTLGLENLKSHLKEGKKIMTMESKKTKLLITDKSTIILLDAKVLRASRKEVYI